ncbi:MAG: helix-turn-helix transcriptional regulator [Candidatus Binatia bacterium]
MKPVHLAEAHTDNPDELGAPALPVCGDVEWRQWMRNFGQQLRRAREFLGMTQEQIARLAGVSQGAVSRLETARGLATPLLVVLKVQRAVAEQLRRLDPAILSPELRGTLDLQTALVPPLGAGTGRPAITSEHDVETLVRIYREASSRHRPLLLSILQAAVEGLKVG